MNRSWNEERRKFIDQNGSVSSDNLLVLAWDVAAISRQQGDKRSAIDTLRKELHRTVAEQELSTAGMKRIELGIVGAIHEASAACNQGGGAIAAGVVLKSLRVRAINTESTVDVCPSPSIRDKRGAESKVARARIGSFATRNIHAWSSSALCYDDGVRETIRNGC